MRVVAHARKGAHARLIGLNWSYQVVQRFGQHNLLAIYLESGQTGLSTKCNVERHLHEHFLSLDRPEL